MRLPTPLLALSAAAAVALDLAVAGAVSHADDGDEVATLAPTQLPPGAFLGLAGQPTGEVAGLTVEAAIADGHYAVAIANPTDAPITARIVVDVQRTEGSAMSRMGPIPMIVHSEPVDIALDPGETLHHALALAAPEPVAPTEAVPPEALLFGSFTTTELIVRTEGDRPEFAQLQTRSIDPVAIALADPNLVVAVAPADTALPRNANRRARR